MKRMILLGLSLAGCGPRCREDAWADAPRSVQGIGDPCLDKSECFGGLACVGAFGGEGDRIQNVCSIRCESAACPSGTVCANLGRLAVCLPKCANDEGCRLGTRAGLCDTAT